MAKLTEAKVRKIQAAYATGKTLRQLAAQYGIAASSIHAAVSGRTWKQVK